MTLAAEDLLRLRWLSDPCLSPDGRLIAYVETRLDRTSDRSRTRVLVIDRAGAPVPWLREETGDTRAPRWSPAGRLAVVESGAQGEAVVVVDAGTGRREERFPLPGRAERPAWSADGRRVAVAVLPPVTPPGSDAYRVSGPAFKLDGYAAGSTRAPSFVAVLDLGGGDVSTVPALGADDHAPAWLPDGRLAYLSDWSRREPGGRWTALVLLGRDGEPRTLVEPTGVIDALAVEPGGAWLAWSGRPRGEDSAQDSLVWVTSPDTGETRALTASLGRCAGMVPRADDPRGVGDNRVEWHGGRVHFRCAEGGRGRLLRAGLDGSIDVLLDGDRAVLDFSLAGDGSCAFIASDPTTPGDVSLREGAVERTLTAANPWLAEAGLGETRHVEVVAADGRSLDAWVTLPASAATAASPVVLSVHGGPHHPAGWRFWFEAQRLAARGYAVITGNPRGSQGYGEDFARLVYGDWGGRDHEDVLAILDAGLTVPGLDADRVAITGVSYGGYMANWAITQGGRFRAAIAENGISDLVSKYGTSPDAGVFMAMELGGPPWERPAVHLERSPLVHADRITTPLLLVHAELDAVCPIQQSEQLHVALSRLGREVEMLRIPGEGHLLNLVGRPSHRLQRAAAVDAWLDRHLPVPVTHAPAPVEA